MTQVLKPGARMEWRRTFSEEDIRRFAELSGDKGVHHLEPDAQGRLMAHGLLTASLPTKLGGDLNYIARTMRFEFLRPVYAGEELRCLGVVDSVSPGSRGRLDVRFSFTVTNSRGKKVMEGNSSGIILRFALAALLFFGFGKPAPAAPGPKRALVIGDSHTVGNFGQALVDGLTAHGWHTTVYSVCGASVSWWLYGVGENRCGWWFRDSDGREDRAPWEPNPRRRRNAPHRQAELARELAAKPELVVIALGANRDEHPIDAGAELLKRVPRESRCFWVRPPPVPHDGCAAYDRASFDSDFGLMKEQSGRSCELIDSSKFLHSTWSDDCHFGNACGTRWGQRASEQITGALPGFDAAQAPDCSKPKPVPLPRPRPPRRPGN